MTQIHPARTQPVALGEVPIPVFTVLPDASSLFRDRAERLRRLARAHELQPYLLFLAGLADVQQQAADAVPRGVLPETNIDAGTPPLRHARYADAEALKPALDLLALLAGALDMPDAAKAALAHVSAAGDGELSEMIRAVLTGTAPPQMLATHSVVAAALQVRFAQLAELLDADALAPMAQCACPACGQPPVASMIVGWPGARGARYCGCAMCGTLWNYVRIKCTSCGSTKGISYQEIEGRKAHAHAETCTSCQSYVKVIRQDQDASADPVADDIASLDIDLLLRDTQFQRAGVNPFLLGY